MFCHSGSPLFSRLKKTLKLESSVPSVESQKVNVNGHVAAVCTVSSIM